VDERDIDEMSEHMIELAEKPELAARMGGRAREHIDAHFSLDKTIKSLWQIMGDAIGEHNLRV